MNFVKESRFEEPASNDELNSYVIDCIANELCVTQNQGPTCCSFSSQESVHSPSNAQMIPMRLLFRTVCKVYFPGCHDQWPSSNNHDELKQFIAKKVPGGLLFFLQCMFGELSLSTHLETSMEIHDNCKSIKSEVLALNSDFEGISGAGTSQPKEKMTSPSVASLSKVVVQSEPFQQGSLKGRKARRTCVSTSRKPALGSCGLQHCLAGKSMLSFTQFMCKGCTKFSCPGGILGLKRLRDHTKACHPHQLLTRQFSQLYPEYKSMIEDFKGKKFECELLPKVNE